MIFISSIICATGVLRAGVFIIDFRCAYGLALKLSNILIGKVGVSVTVSASMPSSTFRAAEEVCS